MVESENHCHGTMSENPADETAEDIKEALYEGRKIEAIKIFREQTGADLADSKKFIEELADELYANEPEKFKAAPNQGGCSPVICMVVTGAIVVLWFGLGG